MPDTDPLTSGPGWELRVAQPADSAALCALFKSQHLAGALDLTQERDPDFFRLPELHHGAFETLIARRKGDAGDTGDRALLGCGTVIVRDGWLDGERIKTGYLGDLRVVPEMRGGPHLARGVGDYFEKVRARHGVDVFTTVIFDDNAPARAALTRRRNPRARMPIYAEMTPFSMTSLQFTTRKPAPESPIRRATAADRDALVDFLGRAAKTRVLGHVLDDDLLGRRLADWPGFGIESFYLAHGSGGRITGCLAPWDTASFKRTRVLGYHGKMRAMKLLFNAGARVLGHAPLPEAGACFRFVFLTHLEVEGDDPRVLRDLLRAAYRDLRDEGYHFMSAMIPRGSPLEAAFSGFFVQRSAMTLYAVHPPRGRLVDRDLRTARPGFEMALS